VPRLHRHSLAVGVAASAAAGR